jgi:bidirectional [NiFe] hydrogenase diaphorase subunit
MSTITLEIDGKSVKAEEGTTVLKAAKSAGIDIPVLCQADKLEPFGACRFCMVEVTKGQRTKLVASCCFPAEEGLVVKTNSDKIRKIRKVILELLLPSAPYGQLPELAKKYGANPSRFPLENDEEPSQCTLCGRCVRYCAEVKKLHAVGFVGRGVTRKVELLPGLGNECVTCRECYSKDICNSGKFVIMADEFPFLPYRSK